MESGEWSVECGVWSVECGEWSVECGGWSVESGLCLGGGLVRCVALCGEA